MFSSVHRCTGDLTCEVLILTCFGNLPPDRQVYLGMGTMIVKETIRGQRSAFNELGCQCQLPVPVERKDDNGDEHDRKTNADTPLADTPTRFPAAPTRRPALRRSVSPLARELNSPFISHGVSRVRTSHLAQIDSDLYLSP